MGDVDVWDEDIAGRFLADYIDSWNKHDLDVVAGAYCEDARRYSGQQVVEGLANIRTSIESFLRAFPDSHVTTVRWASRGDVLFYEALDEAVHSGPLTTPWGTLEPTGRQVSIHAAGVMVMRGRSIAVERVYFDINEMYRQLGVLPENRSDAED